MRHALLMVIALFALALPARIAALEADAGILGQARTLLKKGEYQKAAAIIEDALPTAKPDDKDAMLELLRRSTPRSLVRPRPPGRLVLPRNIARIWPSSTPWKKSRRTFRSRRGHHRPQANRSKRQRCRILNFSPARRPPQEPA